MSRASMDLLTILATALALAMDALAVSIAYGLSFERRRHWDAVKIAGAFGLFQAGMPALGWFGGRVLTGFIEPIDHWVALIVLGYLGGKMVLAAMRGEETSALSTDLKTLLGLAVATSIDALAVGLLIAVLGVPLLLPITLFGIVTFLVAYAGIVSGFELKSLLREQGQRWVQGLGGCVLIAIGIRIAIEHAVGGG
jgi:putative Mn2+ efflux pump MntP